MVLQISTLPILSSDDPTYNVTEEDECSARQIIRHVCGGLKHYFEAHLHTKAQQIRRAKMRDSGLLMTSSMVHNFSTVPGYKVRYSNFNNKLYIHIVFIFTLVL